MTASKEDLRYGKKQYLKKRAARTPCRAIIVCLIFWPYRPKKKRPVGIWGQRYKRYLQQHHEILCYDLLTLQRSFWG